MINIEQKTSVSSCVNQISEKLKSLYLINEVNENIRLWNLQRILVIEETCEQILFPKFEKELRENLHYEAKQHVFVNSALKLRSILNKVGSVFSDLFPLRIKDSVNNQLTVLLIECSSKSNRINLFDFIYLDNLNERLNKEFLSLNSSLNLYKLDHFRIEKQEKSGDLSRLQDLILTIEPHSIYILIENKDDLVLVEEIRSFLRIIHEISLDETNNQGEGYFLN